MLFRLAMTQRACVGITIGLLFMATSCSANSDSSCGNGYSISSYVAGFSQGLDNFSEDRYAQLRKDSSNAYEIAVNSVTHDAVTSEATAVAKKIATFIGEMDLVGWDVNRALDIAAAVNAATELGSEQTLQQANVVEATVLSRCGSPSTFAPHSQSEITLPMNPIASPTATDPIVNTVSDEAELTVIAKFVAAQFGLTVSDAEANCLAEALSGVYDVSGASANQEQYQSQFQKAFDDCGIAFIVPNQ